ncbi:hypothetical protein [Mycobacterium riyadhense]|uniref:hypothetical protein n=1 Tax=Mycobacterium riyadhense TaxID=486698 RepID=UPI001950CF2D
MSAGAAGHASLATLSAGAAGGTGTALGAGARGGVGEPLPNSANTTAAARDSA